MCHVTFEKHRASILGPRIRAHITPPPCLLFLVSPTAMSGDEKEKSSPSRVADAESLDGPAVLHGDLHLVRQLKNRHIAMISIGGVIGTGQCYLLVLPSRNTLSRSLLGYRQLSAKRWSARSASRLHDNGYHLLFCHGKNPPIAPPAL